MNTKVKIAFILLIAVVMAAGCKKEYESERAKENLLTQKSSFIIEDFDVHNFSHSLPFVNYMISLDSIYGLSVDASGAYIILCNLSESVTNVENVFEAAVAVSCMQYSTFNISLKEYILDVAEDDLCCGRVRGLRRFLKAMAQLEYDMTHRDVSHEEYVARYNEAVSRLNNKNGYEVHGYIN